MRRTEKKTSFTTDDVSVFFIENGEMSVERRLNAPIRLELVQVNVNDINTQFVRVSLNAYYDEKDMGKSANTYFNLHNGLTMGYIDKNNRFHEMKLAKFENTNNYQLINRLIIYENGFSIPQIFLDNPRTQEILSGIENLFNRKFQELEAEDPEEELPDLQ